jgi:hypothetical protein
LQQPFASQLQANSLLVTSLTANDIGCREVASCHHIQITRVLVAHNNTTVSLEDQLSQFSISFLTPEDHAIVTAKEQSMLV